MRHYHGSTALPLRFVAYSSPQSNATTRLSGCPKALVPVSLRPARSAGSEQRWRPKDQNRSGGDRKAQTCRSAKAKHNVGWDALHVRNVLPHEHLPQSRLMSHQSGCTPASFHHLPSASS